MSDTLLRRLQTTGTGASAGVQGAVEGNVNGDAGAGAEARAGSGAHGVDHRLDHGGTPARRWCAGEPSDFPCDDRHQGVSSSGRLTGTGSLVAERADDGVLVAATADVPGERIVWLGDVRAALDSGAPLGSPRIRVGAVTPRAELVWSCSSSVVLVECTLPCRPSGQRTFENDDLDDHVDLFASEGGAVARLRPYAGLPAVSIRFNGSVALDGPPRWRSGVTVLDRRGEAGAEDRFSPGTFVVRLPKGTSNLRMTVEVEADLAPPADAALRTDPRGLMAELLAVPGLALESAWSPDQVNGWVARHVGALDLDASGAGLADDRPLWLGRACQLLLRNLRGTWGPLTYRGLVEDTFLPAVRGICARLEASPEHREGPSAGIEAGVGAGIGALRGARRWYELLTGELDAPREGAAVEAGALLHQLHVFAEQLSRMVGDEAGAARAAALALESRRWFQRAFWLSTPRRLSDLEVDRADPRSGAALSMRPGMLIAASLEGAPLDPVQRRAVVSAVDERLLTPAGVRGADRADLGFRSDSMTDGAVWPWLLGLHAEASIRAFGRDPGRLRFQEALLGALDGAPEAWREDAAGQLTPAGDLWFPPGAGESVRAYHLLSEVLDEDEG